MVNSAITGNNLAGSFTTLSSSTNDALTYQNTSAQSIPSGTSTTITTWTKIFDRVNANFNASTGIFTAPTTGVYHVDTALSYAASTGGTVGVGYFVLVVANGTPVCAGLVSVQQTTTATTHSPTVSCDVSLTSGQTILIQANQASGSANALTTAPAAANFVSIHRIP
jgi:hypothetical protein